MAEEQKNSSAETVDAAASAAHTVKGAIKALRGCSLRSFRRCSCRS